MPVKRFRIGSGRIIWNFGKHLIQRWIEISPPVEKDQAGRACWRAKFLTGFVLEPSCIESARLHTSIVTERRIDASDGCLSFC